MENKSFTIQIDGVPTICTDWTDERIGSGYVHTMPDLTQYSEHYYVRGGFLYEKEVDHVWAEAFLGEDKVLRLYA